MADPYLKPPEEEDTIVDNFLRFVENGAISCYGCVHLHSDEITCVAFPELIPSLYLHALDVHTKVVKGQVGTTVYEEKPEE